MKQNMWESREKLEPTREQGGRRSGGSPDSRDRYLGAEGQGEMADRPERVGKVERRRRRREEEFAASRGRRELSTERRRAVHQDLPKDLEEAYHSPSLSPRESLFGRYFND